MIRQKRLMGFPKRTVFVIACIVVAGFFWVISPDRNTALATAGLSLLFLAGAFYARDIVEAWLIHRVNNMSIKATTRWCRICAGELTALSRAALMPGWPWA